MLNEIFVVFAPPLPSADDYQLLIPADNYSPTEIVIVQIDLSYHFAYYDESSNNYIVGLQKDSGFVNFDANSRITIILYDYNLEMITDSRRGEIILNQIISPQIVLTVPCQETDISAWRGTALVSSVEGPFQDGVLVNELNLENPVYYLAVPNSKTLSDSQLLSIRWEYQYNGGTNDKFNFSKRFIVEDKGLKKCKIECQFHNRSDITSVRMYAFYLKPADHVSSVVSVKGAKTNCKITLAELEKMCGVYSKQKEFRQTIIDYLNKYIYSSGKDIHINTPLRKRHFFAQVGAETLGVDKNWMVETDVYRFSPKSAKGAFGKRARTLEAKGLLADYCAERPQKKLLNYMYAAENGNGNGNGNEKSGDGYKYRGRGLKQLTGKYNYSQAQKFIQSTFQISVDLVKNPDLVAQPQYAVLSAIAYWENNNVWKLADKYPNPTNSEFEKIRRSVNGGVNGLDAAIRYFKKGDVFEKDCNNSGSSNSTAIDTPEDSNIPSAPSTPGDGSWRDPVDNPICTLYMQSGGGGEYGKHWGLFGKTRRKKDGSRSTHQGLDLFAVTGSNIYACVDGTIYNRQWHGGYGNTITVKVKDTAAFLAQKLDYKLQFEKAGEIKQGTNWNEKVNIFLFYAHLHTVNEFNFKDKVVSGQVLGTTGRSGVKGGTLAPHLHFEIFSDYTMAVGTKYRINPAFFVNYKGFDQQTEEEKGMQKREKDNEIAKRKKKLTDTTGQFNGEKKLEYKTMPGFKK